MAASRYKDDELLCADRLRVDGVHASWSFPRIAEEIYARCHDRHGTTMLRAHRLARGWSPHTVLAEVNKRYIAEHGMAAKADRALLSNWENGRRSVAGSTYLPYLLDVYDVVTFMPGTYLDETPTSRGENDLDAIRAILLDAVRNNVGGQGTHGTGVLARRRETLYGLADASGVTVPASMRRLLDEGRDSMDNTFSAGSISAERMEDLKAGIARRRIDHRYEPPLTMLRQLLLDWFEVQELLTQRRPTKVQRDLYAAAVPIGILIADTLMKLGEFDQSQRYYDLASRAANDSENVALVALVLAQQSMLPYYYGTSKQVLALTSKAQQISRGRPCVGSALGSAMEARVLARIAASRPNVGQIQLDAQRAWGNARDLYEQLNDSQRADMALSFPVRRHLFYNGSTAGYLGRRADLEEARREAAGYYPPQDLST